MPLPTSTIPTDNSLETYATHPAALRPLSWEEPHPGRRLSCPNDTPTTWGNLNGGEHRRGGMAAKEQWPNYAADFSFTAPTVRERRHGRGRARNMSEQLVLEDAGHARPEIQTAPLPRPNIQPHHTDDASRTESTRVAREVAPADEETLVNASPDLSGTDSDTDSSISAPPRKKLALRPLNTSFHGLHLTDLSKNLGISMGFNDSERHTFSTSYSDAAAFSVMSPDEDLYGWNAVLDRKIIQPSHETPAPNQQRRASRSKRSLLQRVFSPGGNETAVNPPTSCADLDFSELEA